MILMSLFPSQDVSVVSRGSGVAAFSRYTLMVSTSMPRRSHTEDMASLQGWIFLLLSEFYTFSDYLFLGQFPDIIWARISAFFGEAKKCRLRGPNYIGETDAGNMSFYS